MSTIGTPRELHNFDGGKTTLLPIGISLPAASRAGILYAQAVEGVVEGEPGGPEGPSGDPGGGPGDPDGGPGDPDGGPGDPDGGPGDPGGGPGETEGGPGETEGGPGETEGGPGETEGGPGGDDGAPKSWGEAQNYSDEFASQFKTKPTQPTKDLKEIYQLAADNHDKLVEVTKELAKSTDGEVKIRSKLKGMDRAQEKIEKDYDGDASKLLDVDGSTILYKKIGSVYDALAELRERSDVEIVFFKDRFVKPVPSGFRDILLNVAFGDYVTELRLGVDTIQGVSDHEEHDLYEFLRSQTEPLSKEDEQKVSERREKLRKKYDDLFNEANQF